MPRGEPHAQWPCCGMHTHDGEGKSQGARCLSPGFVPQVPPPHFRPPREGTYNTVHSLQKEEGASLVVGGRVGEGAMCVGREGGMRSVVEEGGGDRVSVEGNKVLCRKLSTACMVLGLDGETGVHAHLARWPTVGSARASDLPAPFTSSVLPFTAKCAACLRPHW